MPTTIEHKDLTGGHLSFRLQLQFNLPIFAAGAASKSLGTEIADNHTHLLTPYDTGFLDNCHEPP